VQDRVPLWRAMRSLGAWTSIKGGDEGGTCGVSIVGYLALVGVEKPSGVVKLQYVKSISMGIGRGKDCEVAEGRFLVKHMVYFQKNVTSAQTTYFLLLGFQHWWPFWVWKYLKTHFSTLGSNLSCLVANMCTEYRQSNTHIFIFIKSRKWCVTM